MQQRINDLHLRRGRLLERIAGQRSTLTQDLRPFLAPLGTTDRLLARLRAGTDYLKRRPGILVLAGAVLVAAKPSRVWRWTRRGLFAWQSWRALRGRLYAHADRAGFKAR